MARNRHAPGSIHGRNGTAQRPITVPVPMITPKVAMRSARSAFSSAFHEACMRAAASSSPTIRGETTIGWRSACLVVGELDGQAHMDGFTPDMRILVGANQRRKPV